MITKDALEYLADNFASRMIFDDYTSHAVAAALPKGVEIHSLERFQTKRNRFRGTFQTSSITHFGAYVADRVSQFELDRPTPSCFIDPERMTATMIFNLGTEQAPEHGDDRAVFAPKPGAAYAALQALCTRQLGQQALADWIEDWASHITFRGPAGEEISPAKGIAAVRSVTIDAKRSAEHNVAPMATSRSTFEQVEAKSREGMPQAFDFGCMPYPDMETRTIRVRLAIRTGGEAPVFVPMIVGAEALLESLTHEFAELLDTLFEDGSVKTFVGTFQQGA